MGKKAMTIRLSDELKARVEDYGNRYGLSFSALVTVSLIEYLKQHDGDLHRPDVPPEPASDEQWHDEWDDEEDNTKYGFGMPDFPGEKYPGTARGAPCPCGSGKKYKRCCGVEAPSEKKRRK